MLQDASGFLRTEFNQLIRIVYNTALLERFGVLSAQLEGDETSHFKDI